MPPMTTLSLGATAPARWPQLMIRSGLVEQAAMTAAFMVTLLPSIMLSGFVFPITSMPVPIQWITTLIPARHFLVIVRGIFLKGAGLVYLWRPALILLGFGLLFLGVSSRRFKKKL